MTPVEKNVVVVGGGQAALAAGWYLRRHQLDFVILDNQQHAGGAWNHGWESLRLFSPAAYSSLPGWPMPEPEHEGFPSRQDVISYLTAYEARYQLPIERPVNVSSIVRTDDGRLLVSTGHDSWLARVVICATGTWSNPYIPYISGRELFAGIQLHSAHYERPDRFTGKTVLVVGGGNSGAQIQAEVSRVANSTWVTQTPPEFLPDDVDGRVLFQRATAMHRGEAVTGGGLGFANIVMVPPVREARDRGALRSVRPFVRMTRDGVVWSDGSEGSIDAIIWCTGFRAALSYLADLGIVGSDGRVAVTAQGQSIAEPRLWLHGFGDWTGFASATLIGCGRMARDTVRAIAGELT